MEREISLTPFDLLSNETHLNILDLVGFPGILGYYLTSKSAHNICQSDYLWNLLYKRDLSTFPRRSASARMDYLRTHHIIHKFADDFVEKFSMGNPQYVSRDAQKKSVITLIKKYFSELDKGILEKWQKFANLTKREREAIRNRGEYEDDLERESEGLSSDLLDIMLGLDNSTLMWIHEHDWFETTIEYCSKIEDFMIKLLTTRTMREEDGEDKDHEDETEETDE